MKKKLIVASLLLSTHLFCQAPLKKRVIMHKLQNNLNTLLEYIGVENVSQAKRKIRRFDELLAHLETPNASAALKKIKKIDMRLYQKEKQNEKLVAKNQQIIAHADSLESTLQNIIDTRNQYAHKEYKRKHQTNIDIFAKIPEKLPRIKKKRK